MVEKIEAKMQPVSKLWQESYGDLSSKEVSKLAYLIVHCLLVGILQVL